MPRKKKSESELSPKKVGLFDHIKHVNQVQSPNYFVNLSDADKSTWSNWMVLRALSYNPNYTETVNEIQQFVSLPSEIMYKLLIDIFPKDRGFYPFIKGKSRQKFGDSLISLVSKHFEISESESIEYLTVFFLSEENKSELSNIIALYGKTEKEIKELLKI